MKKGAVELTILSLFLLVLLSSGVFAVAEGTCAIVAKASCDTPITEGYALIGLSAATNAHAQQLIGVAFADWYPSVLCCAFGDGNKGCSTEASPIYGSSVPANKILGLSSLTNAHAEVTGSTNYQTVKICYEDLTCIKRTTGCTASDGIEIVNLSSDTNAHVGTGAGFQTAICCKSSKFLSSCQLTAAKWQRTTAIFVSDEVRQGVRLEVTGSGLECDNQAISFQIMDNSSEIKHGPTTVGFNGATATGIWYVEHQKCGAFGTADCSYRFNATIVRSIPSKSMISSNKLTVSKVDLEDVGSVSSCSDYANKEQCESDESLFNVANTSSLTPELKCTDPGINCYCTWDTTKNACTLSYFEIKSGLCKHGFTSCTSPLGIDYCFPTTDGKCPAGQTAPSDKDGKCEVDESCASSDCKNGDQASCVTGATCQSGKCYTSGASIVSPLCNYGFTLCREPTGKNNYCYPGTTCLSGNSPVQDGDKKCEIGEGCLLSADSDCKDGDPDSCSNDTFCSSGKCSSIEDPITLISSGGGCKISQTIEKACDQEPVGYKVLKWTGVWTGDAASKTGDAYQRCITGGTTNVPCPAQVALPFFDYYEVALTIIVIALIYLSLIFKRKLKRKKK